MGGRREDSINHTAGSQQLSSLSRRDLLAGTAVTIACAFVPASSLSATPAAPKPTPADILTAAERRALEAVVSRIIPADADGPGALEAGCARYIESALADAYQSVKGIYSLGLAALNSHSMASGGKGFAALGVTEQDQILSAFEQNQKIGDYGDSGTFFELVRRHTLEGMFGDPSYGGNANFAGWDLIGYPGPRMYAAPDTQKMDAKILRSRASAKQLVHGSD